MQTKVSTQEPQNAKVTLAPATLNRPSPIAPEMLQFIAGGKAFAAPAAGTLLPRTVW